MTHNLVIRSLRYTINVSDKKLLEIFSLSGLTLPLNTIENFLKDEEDASYIECDDEAMAHFLDGLIFFKRGKDESKPRFPVEFPIDNNIILKKLKVAFNLKEPDMHEVLEMGGYPVGRSELSALLRKRGQPNYRECGDQVLRYFLKGLKVRFRD